MANGSGSLGHAEPFPVLGRLRPSQYPLASRVHSRLFAGNPIIRPWFESSSLDQRGSLGVGESEALRGAQQSDDPLAFLALGDADHLP